MSPDAGWVSGGTWVQIHGSGFAPGAQAQIGEAPCLATQWQGPGQLVCQLGAVSVSGRRDLIVTNPDGESATLPGAYVYEATIQTIAPSSGPASGGAQVNVLGSGFHDGVEIWLGSSPCQIQSLRPAQISCVSSPSAPGTVTLSIVNPQDRLERSYWVNGYTYLPSSPGPTPPPPGGPVILRDISPNLGSARGGDLVNVSAVSADLIDVIYLGGTPCRVLDRGADHVSCVTGPHWPGIVEVTAVDRFGGFSTLFSAFQYW